MKRTPLIFLTLGLVLVPSTASANTVSTFAFYSTLQLFVGNALIGMVEGLLLSRIFKAPVKRSILILIAANYVSAFAGIFLTAGQMAGLSHFITIENVRGWFLLFVVLAFGMTLVIERPFFRRALRFQQLSSRQIWQAVLVVNAISYLALGVWSWMISYTSMMTRLRVVAPGELQPPGEYALYYLSSAGDQVIQTDLRGGESTVLLTHSSPHRDDRLEVRSREEGGYDVLTFFAATETRHEIIAQNSSSHMPPDSWATGRFKYGPVLSLAPHSDWELRTGPLPEHGLSGKHKTTGEQFRYALGTPFVWWTTGHATQLEGDFVVCQMGDDQICLLHLASKKIALLARGKRPVVAPQPEISPP